MSGRDTAASLARSREARAEPRRMRPAPALWLGRACLWRCAAHAASRRAAGACRDVQPPTDAPTRASLRVGDGAGPEERVAGGARGGSRAVRAADGRRAWCRADGGGGPRAPARRAGGRPSAVSIDLFTQDNNQLAPLVGEGAGRGPDAVRRPDPRRRRSGAAPGAGVRRPPLLPAVPAQRADHLLSGVSTSPQYGLTPAAHLGRADGRGPDVRRCGRSSAASGDPGRARRPVGVRSRSFSGRAAATRWTWTAPGSVRAFEYLQQLEPYLSPVYQTAKFDTMNTYLASRDGLSGPELAVRRRRDRAASTASRTSAPTPAGPGRRRVPRAGRRGDRHPEGTRRGASWRSQFAQFLMSRPVQEALLQRLAWPPMREDAFGAVAEWQQPYFAAVQAALRQARRAAQRGLLGRRRAHPGRRLRRGGAPASSPRPPGARPATSSELDAGARRRRRA